MRTKLNITAFYLIRLSRGSNRLRTRSGVPRAEGHDVVSPGEPPVIRLSPDHLQRLPGRQSGGFHPLQHRPRARAQHCVSPSGPEALLLYWACVPGGLHHERRGHEPVARVGLHAVARHQAPRLGPLRVVRELCPYVEGGPSGDSPWALAQ